mmetsp:Transcript_26859/g.80982  ORF Transcript_26859/g.80982 Transcript_26859/m.80982 type:complete len:212 (-) Transcript_26859:42-677(-)
MTAATVAPASSNGRTGPNSELAPKTRKVRLRTAPSFGAEALIAAPHAGSIVPASTHLSHWASSSGPRSSAPWYGSTTSSFAGLSPLTVAVLKAGAAAAMASARLSSLSVTMARAFSMPAWHALAALPESSTDITARLSVTTSIWSLYFFRHSFSAPMACARSWHPSDSATACQAALLKGVVPRSPFSVRGKRTPGILERDCAPSAKRTNRG